MINRVFDQAGLSFSMQSSGEFVTLAGRLPSNQEFKRIARNEGCALPLPGGMAPSEAPGPLSAAGPGDQEVTGGTALIRNLPADVAAFEQVPLEERAQGWTVADLRSPERGLES